MPTTLAELKRRLLLNFKDITFELPLQVEEAINIAIFITASQYRPPELDVTGSLTVSGSATSVALTTLTNLLALKSLYNETASSPVGLYYSISRFRLTAPTVTGNVKTACQWGTTLFILPSPAVANTLTAVYTKYPTYLDEDTDQVDFSNFDEAILTFATTYLQAVLKGQDFMQAINLPSSLSARLRGIYGNNLQGA